MNRIFALTMMIILKYLWTLAPIGMLLGLPICAFGHVHQMIETLGIFILDLTEPDWLVWGIRAALIRCSFCFSLTLTSSGTLLLLEPVFQNKRMGSVRRLWLNWMSAAELTSFSLNCSLPIVPLPLGVDLDATENQLVRFPPRIHLADTQIRWNCSTCGLQKIRIVSGIHHRTNKMLISL